MVRTLYLSGGWQSVLGRQIQDLRAGVPKRHDPRSNHKSGPCTVLETLVGLELRQIRQLWVVLAQPQSTPDIWTALFSR